jgi:hypothetical protein
MVTTKTFERLSNISPQIATAAGTSEEVVRKVLEIAKTDIINRRRRPAAPPPEGGISIRAAERKYKINSQTISGWAKRGIVTVLLRTNNEVFISDKEISNIAKKFSQARGRGKRTIIKEFSR